MRFSKTVIVIAMTAIFIGCVVLTGTMVALDWVFTVNSHNRLVNRFNNIERENEADFDNEWKTISQQEGIPDEDRNGFLSCIRAAALGRSDRALMKSARESMPGLRPEVYTRIVKTIEEKRSEFETMQRILSNVKVEDDSLLNVFPSSVFLSGRAPLEFENSEYRHDLPFPTTQVIQTQTAHRED